MGKFKDKTEFAELYHRYNKDKSELQQQVLIHGNPIRLFVSKEKVIWRFSDGFSLEVEK